MLEEFLAAGKPLPAARGPRHPVAYMSMILGCGGGRVWVQVLRWVSAGGDTAGQRVGGYAARQGQGDGERCVQSKGVVSTLSTSGVRCSLVVLGTLTVCAVRVTADGHEGGSTIGCLDPGVGGVGGGRSRQEGVDFMLERGVNGHGVTGRYSRVRIVRHVPHDLRRTPTMTGVRGSREKTVFVMSGVAGMV